MVGNISRTISCLRDSSDTTGLVLGPCGHDRVDDLRETFHLFFHSSAGEIHTTANIGGCLRASGENLGYSSRIVDAGPRLV
jgi:hypothetical protein